MTEAYPLQWPPGWPRTRRPEFSRFDTGMARARDGLLNELRLMGAKHVVISSNADLGRNGLPLARQRQVDDCGVAVYFMFSGRQQCIPCDRWRSIPDNIQAIRKTVEALRGLERWGAKSMVDAAFRGFEALPAPEQERAWWQTLGTHPGAQVDEINRAWRRKARENHPDQGGSAARMAEINAARDEGLAARA